MKRLQSEAICACTLNRALGYEPAISHRIISTFGSASAFFALSEKERLSALGPYSKYIRQLSDDALAASEKELDSLKDYGAVFMHIGSPAYPALLAECEDAPVGLYIRASSPLEDIFTQRPMISIVGTRDISLYGKEWCQRIVGALAGARNQPCIVSGLALGVDITAHMAALTMGLPTIAVSPTGIDNIYPRRHSTPAEKIISSPGSALITDYPPQTAPVAITFLRRNRIIAGLSSATILVESKAHGGGMITARLAASYGRDVLALPGRVEDLRSEGCNILIKENIAQIITSPDSLAQDLGLGRYDRKKKAEVEEEVMRFYSASMGKEEAAKMVQAASQIKKLRGITTEELGEALGCGYLEAARMTGILERDSFIEIDLLQRCSIALKNV